MLSNIARAGALAALFLTQASATPLPASNTKLQARANTGEATFYGGNVEGGMCSFSGYSIPSGIYGTALSDSNWDTAGNCGACLKVTGPNGNSITAMVVDQCPGCGENHLDLFQDAFAKLDDISKGIIEVKWEIVDCGISSPMTLKNKEGTSAYWFSMQAENINTPVKSLQVSTDGGSTWQSTTRTEYNYFENSSGFGSDTLAIKVTNNAGKEIITKNVGVTGGSTVEAATNF
ncbi:putative expansin-like protein 1 protein [Neofusicoccum parvum UCRNP2]|uniref:Expansin-like protein 1 protein n=2 Tax=Neofusicoccum parvum TaxID=310453 RepID=A0ACB5SGR1_9PEZI|nr:putative expansin-like protein 1 protein [Neofusicoccum parvum UCRNP2]GME40213.1 putative expansin-like protein 1 protein [Neofusicoccum parvum]